MVPGALTEKNFSVLGKQEVNSLYKKNTSNKNVIPIVLHLGALRVMG